MDQFQSSYPDVDDLLPAELKPVPIASNFTYGSSPYSPGPSTPAPLQASARPASPESEHIVAWRAKQAEEIKKRDEKSKEVREEKVRKAERDIDAFYEEYNKGKEQAIKENKCVPPLPPLTPSRPTSFSTSDQAGHVPGTVSLDRPGRRVSTSPTPPLHPRPLRRASD